MSETEPKTEPNPELAMSLNITDIADAVKIMDYASEQGAFKGWSNIRQILLVRDRLELFVETASRATEQAPLPELEQELSNETK